MALIISFLFVKTGLTFVGAIIGLLGGIIINLLIIYILYNFIVDKKANIKLVFISFISSLIAIGVGIGLFIIGIKNFNITTDYSNKTEKTIEMNDKLLFHNWYDTDYIEEDRSDIKIVVEHSGLVNVNIDYMEDEKFNIANVFVVNNSKTDSAVMQQIIKDINNKKIVDYGDVKIKVYASKENIEKIKNNYDSWNTTRWDEEEIY